MPTIFRLVLALLFVFALSGESGRARRIGDPYPPPPPDVPYTRTDMNLNENYDPASLTLAGTLVLNQIGTLTDATAEFVRNVARSLLPARTINVIYAAEAEPVDRRDRTGDGKPQGDPAGYQEISVESITPGFLATVPDFLVTDGKQYFRILLSPPEP